MIRKIYIAGPMRGYPLYNFNAFAASQDVVLNPSRNLEVRADRSERESAAGGAKAAAACIGGGARG